MRSHCIPECAAGEEAVAQDGVDLRGCPMPQVCQPVLYSDGDECTEQDLQRHHGQTYTIIDISEQTNDHYEYTLILGQSINQRDTDTDANYFLGNYGHIEGYTEFYINGSGFSCPGNKKRSATIHFVQGTEPALLDSSEPSVCQYEFTFAINCKV